MQSRDRGREDVFMAAQQPPGGQPQTPEPKAPEPQAAPTKRYGDFTGPDVRHQVSPKSRLVTLLLAFFVGHLGVHRYYVRKVRSGVILSALSVLGYLLMGIGLPWGLVLVAGAGIAGFVDFVFVCLGIFRDNDARPITNWSSTPK